MSATSLPVESERAPLAALLPVAAVAGAGVMAVELSAVRLVAPWFGSSLTVWTNVLGVVLAALGFGYLAGARLAAIGRPVRALCVCLSLGALSVAVTPQLAGPLCDALLPDSLRLEQASGLLLWGSLAAATALFFPAAGLLGAVGPLTVEAVQRRRGGHAGAAGGMVLCVSTFGSLVGTFATTHALLPVLGVNATFLAAAAALALSAAALAPWARALPAAGVTLLGLGWAVVAGEPESGPPLAPGRRLVALEDSAYQRVRVVETPGPDGEVWRQLEVNERSDSFQSVWTARPGLLGPGYYYDDFAMPVWWEAAHAGRAPGRWRVLILGLGAGTAWRVLEGSVPPGCSLSGTGVEIDPTVVRLAREHLDLPDPGGPLEVLSGMDARVALRTVAGEYDQVILDTYANQVEIPPHLATIEFIREVGARLRPGGWLTVNVGAFGLEDPLVAAIGASAASALGEEVVALSVPRARNVTLVARRDAEVPSLELQGSPPAPAGIANLFETRRSPSGARRIGPDSAQTLSDDRAATFALARDSIQSASNRPLPGPADGRALLEPDGTADPQLPLLERARLSSRRFEAAGDLRAAYALSLLGLDSAPQDLELHLRAAATALALLRPEVARAHLVQLEHALALASEMGEQDRAWWRARVDENRAWLEEQDVSDAARRRSTERAQRWVLIGACVAAAASAVALPRS